MNENEKSWGIYASISIVITVIDFIIMCNQEDASNVAKICALILIVLGILDAIFLVNWWKNTPTINTTYINNPNLIKCPYCKSVNVKKITTTSRAVSIGAVGLASGKIGKQWHCNNCKSDF